MRVTEPTTNGIDDLAAQWVARLDRGLNEDEAAALDRWIAEDARHRGALLRAQALFATFDRARALGEDVPLAVPRAISRRLLVGGGVSVVAAALVGGSLLSRSAVEQRDYTTPTGGVRSVALADGSVVTLDAASSLTVRLSADRREVALRAGRALFDVAKDRARPFIVSAGGWRVRAVGTSFSVERRGVAGAEVLMRHGIVEVRSAADPSDVVRLAAAERLIVGEGSPLRQRVDPAALDRALGWRSGMLDFADVSLAQAADTFARYGRYRIVVAPEVADLRITGRFSAGDPRGFAQAAALSLGIRAQPDADRIILSR